MRVETKYFAGILNTIEKLLDDCEHGREEEWTPAQIEGLANTMVIALEVLVHGEDVLIEEEQPRPNLKPNQSLSFFTNPWLYVIVGLLLLLAGIYYLLKRIFIK